MLNWMQSLLNTSDQDSLGIGDGNAAPIPTHAAPQLSGEQLQRLELQALQLQAIATADIAQAALTRRTLDHFLPYIARLISERFGFYHVAIYLLDDSRQRVVCLADSSVDDDWQTPIMGHIVDVGDSSLVGQATLIGEPRIISSESGPLSQLLHQKMSNTRSQMALPLVADDQLLGALDIHSTQAEAFAAGDMALFERLAEHVAVAIENVRLFEQAQSQQAEHKQAEAELSTFAAKLEHRTPPLQMAAEVTRDATTVHELDELLVRAIDVIQEWFDFYFVGICLIDEQGKYAILRAASGVAGRQLLAAGKRFEVGKDGIVGYVARSGQPYITFDVTIDDLHQASALIPHTRSEMVLPLKVSHQVIGVLDVHSRRVAAFDKEDVAVMQIMTDQLAVAIQNVQLFGETQRQLQELSGLYEISQAFSELTNAQDIYGRLVEQLAHLVGAPICFVMKYDEATSELYAQPPGYGLNAELLEMMHYSTPATVNPWNLDTDGLFVANSSAEIPPMFTQHVPPFDAEAILVAPLRVEGNLIGSVVVANKPGGFDRNDSRLLEIFSVNLAVAIEREQAQRRYRMLAENVTDLIWLMDMDNQMRFTYITPSVRQVLGYTVEETLAQPIDKIMTPDSFEIAMRVLAEELDLENVEGEHAAMRTRTVEMELIAKDGRRVWTETKLTFLRSLDNQPVATLGVARDITERKRTEEALRQSEARLRQAQKMEAVGRLAGGVAHDFNNLLAVINGYSGLLMRTLDADDSHYHYAEQIQEAGDRAAGLTAQLLAFSRKQVLQPKILDLNSVVTGVERMLQRLIGEDVEMVTMLGMDIGQVKADPGQLEQMIMNLVINARDAMPQGGKLTISTGKTKLAVEAAQALDIPAGDYVMLSVIDTGTGINEETQTRIFEPFFTTKEHGKGTGLGLATVYGIAKQSGGAITLESALGQGTTFYVYLPCVEMPQEAPVEEATSEGSPQGSETILLVEDDDMVRAIIQESLEISGYNVLTAHNGYEALRICGSYNGNIHLVVTDVVMPEMGGRELTERLLADYETLKVLYISGYTDDAVLQSGIESKSVNFLQKPFTPDALAYKVREVLDSPLMPISK